jgi:hypothetical protein
MNNRTKTLWLSSRISLGAAMAVLMISTKPYRLDWLPGAGSLYLHTATGTSLPLGAYLPCLVLLPFCGSLGAYLSRRAGGPLRLRLVGGLFPWMALFGVVVFLTLIGQIVPFRHEWLDFATALLWVSVPPGGSSGAFLVDGSTP